VQILIDWFLWPDGFDVIKTELTKRQEIKLHNAACELCQKCNRDARSQKDLPRAPFGEIIFTVTRRNSLWRCQKMHKKILSYFSNPLKKL